MSTTPYNSWGNGSAMRVSPVGFAGASLDEVLERAADSAAVTHNHPEGIKGAQATAAAIYLARTGKPKQEIKEYVEQSFGYDLGRRLDDIRPTFSFDASCQGTVPPAFIAFLESTDFEDAIRKAISLGGDSDTLACITGGIAHAFYGRVPRAIHAQVFTRLDSHLAGVTRRVHRAIWLRVDRMNPWTIREATDDDAPALAHVIQAAFDEFRGRLDPPSGAHGESSDSIRRKLTTAKAAVAERDETLLGCVFFEPEPGRIYVSRLSVLPAERRRGVGHALMDFAENWARGQGLERAYLGVRIVLQGQQAYYARRGYRVVGEAAHPGYASATYLLMEKDLSES